MKNFIIIVILALAFFYLPAFAGALASAISLFQLPFAAVFLYYFINKSEDNSRLMISFYIICLPIVNFTKGSFFTYNIHIVVLLLITFKLLLYHKNYYLQIFRTPRLKSLFIFALFYYLLSFITTGNYASNLRIFELILMAGTIPFLWLDKKIFANTIKLLLMNAILFVGYATTFGGRLMVEKSDLDEGMTLGGNNPIGFGLPIAFCLVLLITQREYLKGFISSKLYITLIVAGILCLILTTSRGSMTALALGILTYVFVKKKYKLLLKVLSVGALAFIFLVTVGKENKTFRFAYEFLIERTEENQDDLNKVSSGRLEQWELVGAYIMKYHPWDLVIGNGAGQQAETHDAMTLVLLSKTSLLYGRWAAFHALPLQIFIEIGLIGLLIFYSIIYKIFKANKEFLSKSVLPLIGLISFVSIGLSVSSLDPFAGLFFGLAWLPVLDKVANTSYFNRKLILYA